MNNSQSSDKRKLRIAICGAGIGGMALAVVLGKYEREELPLEVNLYERRLEASVLGAGISVWQRTWRVMELLGLDQQLSEAAERPPNKKMGPGFVYRRSDRTENNYTFYRIMMPYGSSSMHRADLIGVLARNIPARYAIHYGKKLISYSEISDGNGDLSHLELHFEDGSMVEADILIGADGIRSAVRACMYDIAHSQDCISDVDRAHCPRCSAATPTWSGVIAYRSLVSTEKLRKINPEHEAFRSTLSFVGKTRHVVSYPVSHGNFINLVGYVTDPNAEGSQYNGKWAQPVTIEEVSQAYGGWEHELHQMIECISGDPIRWAIMKVDSLSFCVSGRVALLGDSMHAMESHLGSGAGQSIESAYILGRLLAHPLMALERIHDTLHIYQSIRLQYGYRILQRARDTGRHCEFDYPGCYDGSPCADERKQLEELGKALAEQWSWQWRESYDAQWDAAERAMDQSLRVEAQKTQA